MPRPRGKLPAELRPGVIGILSRPGAIEEQADEICALVARLGKQAAAAPVQRCQNPDDPHPGTELVAARCPICGWSPFDHTAT